MENSGPLLRSLMGIKGVPLLWHEKWLSYITGTRISGGHLQEIGARIFNLERMYNLREGLFALFAINTTRRANLDCRIWPGDSLPAGPSGGS